MLFSNDTKTYEMTFLTTYPYRKIDSWFESLFIVAHF